MTDGPMKGLSLEALSFSRMACEQAIPPLLTTDA